MFNEYLKSTKLLHDMGEGNHFFRSSSLSLLRKRSLSKRVLWEAEVYCTDITILILNALFMENVYLLMEFCNSNFH